MWITVKDGSGDPVAGHVTLDAARSVWTFTPAVPLAWNLTYLVEITGAKDGSGNAMGPYSWSFATVTDHAAPVVTGTTPARDATDVDVVAPIKVVFDEPVSDARFSVKDPAGQEITGAVDADGAGNVMASYGWSFTTVPPDEATPTVSETVPVRDATEVAPSTPIRVTFTEPVTGAQVVVKRPDGAVVAGVLNVDSPRSVSFLPTAALGEETIHTVEVTGARDAAGNTMAATPGRSPRAWSRHRPTRRRSRRRMSVPPMVLVRCRR
ncbi:Ig-like domain-containing protein [Nonomuraea sp. NPDC059023]|uniref:Ig-like domain-containing protein n=1 Tax=unclassified Nonomuraea TaxID=2593643 RepID=UPI00367E5311